MRNPLSEYAARLETLTFEQAALNKRQGYLPWLRLLTFFCSAAAFWQAWKHENNGLVFLGSALLIVFVILTEVDRRLGVKIRRLNGLIQINELEIKALNGDFSNFDPGLEYLDPTHAYSYDLDVFGPDSIFQALNRSASVYGKNRLAQYFSDAHAFADQLAERQEAVRELSENCDFRQELQVVFYEKTSHAKDRTTLGNWLDAEETLLKAPWVRVVAYALPALTTALTGLWALGLFPFPAVLVVLQLLIVGIFNRRIMQNHAALSRQADVLQGYADALALLEKTPFKSPLLRRLQTQLEGPDTLKASAVLRKLTVILNRLDSNLNVFAAIVLNGFLMMNLHLLLALARWKKQYKSTVLRWFDALGEADALCSIGNFASNNPTYTFPEAARDTFRWTAQNLGHPMIPAPERVLNGLDIRGWNQFRIITGANMSGKSTFLRTVGVNHLLAMMGAPVCAERLIFSPLEIHSSIRTSDSLAKHESYFYAELKRLKSIIDELRAGRQKLILLDEILKGTNSGDKQSGSIALIKQLLRYRSTGLFATHDLALGDLEKTYPDNVKNLCFEIEIRNATLHIDYRLRTGVCKNLNATFLMKEMGISD
jgi:MutS domain V